MYENASNLMISPDGGGFSYKFSKRIKISPVFTKVQNFISMNGEISENDLNVVDLQTNSIGIEAIVYKRKENWYLSLNETMFGPYDQISDWKFLPDDSLFSFKFKEPKSDYFNLQINGRTYYSRNKNLQVNSPIFSSDLKKFTFLHYSQTHCYVQVSDETLGPFIYSDFPSFSPDSKVFIFRYSLDDGVYLNINGMKIGPFGKAEYSFSDGKLYICYLQDNFIFIDEITW
jgi:hypothetical protein